MLEALMRAGKKLTEYYLKVLVKKKRLMQSQNNNLKQQSIQL